MLVPVSGPPPIGRILRSADGKTLYHGFRAGAMEALEKLEIAKDTPRIRWHGGRIGPDVWVMVSGFLNWSQRETKSEALVYLAYSEEKAQWLPWVPAQRGYSGMTVSPLPDHELTARARASLPPHNGGVIVTVHHHCTASAFQSGTDERDELGKTGLHITLGHMSAARHDLHARAVFEQTQTEAVLSDWFAMTDELERAAEVAPDLREQLVSSWLTLPIAQEMFPEWWKAQILRPEPPKVREYTGYTNIYGSADDYLLPTHYHDNATQTWREIPQDVRQARVAETDLETEFRRICQDYQCELPDIANVLQETDAFSADVYGALIAAGAAFWEAEEVLDDMSRAKNADDDTQLYTPEESDKGVD